MNAGWLALAMALAPSLACAEDDEKVVIDWVSKPADADYLANAPADALQQGLDGHAMLSCGVARSGQLQACVVTEETPKGAGFGSAALRLAPLFKTTTAASLQLGGEKIQIRIPFRLKGRSLQTASAPAAPGPPPVVPASYGQSAASTESAPPEILGLTPPAGRLTALGVVPGWQAYFLDNDRVQRRGGAVEVVRMTVFARARPVGDRVEVYEVSATRFDCAGGGRQALGARGFDNAHQPVAWTPAAPSAEPNEPGSPEATLAAQVCAGILPSGAQANGAAEAVAAALSTLSGQ
jgi:hypothetical protein